MVCGYISGIHASLRGGAAPQRHEDHPGAGAEGDGPAGDAGEGRRARLLRHQQPQRGAPADVPAGLHHASDVAIDRWTCWTSSRV